ncbi:MAG TPA: S46 family peptidase [Candidatus Desulfaltia sp.]|nr:S46 family peptidase [Candidatus Desulfaltia sp.]
MQTIKRTALISLLLLIFLLPMFPDEGLWLFNMPPTELLKARYKFTPELEWLNHLQLSSIRLGGASASFVSGDGLVFTNHHVGAGAIQNLSTKERDLMKTGFYARTREEELKCPGMEFLVLQGIEDVTERVRAAEESGQNPAEAAAAREKFIASLEKDSSEQTGLRCQVVSLYAGGLYHLYKYKVYTDIRLVFAPEYAMAFFGGDPDNFTYPRYDLDITFFRVYENDQPLQTSHFLRWATQPVKEGDLVFASGNPGSTGRLLTLSQLEFLRDVGYPFMIGTNSRRRALLAEYSKKGPEESRIALRTLFGIENSLKAIGGYQSGLLDPKLTEKKAQEERAFRDELGKDPAMAEEFGRAWDEIAEAQKSYASFYKPYAYFERGTGFNTNYFRIARSLVRLAVEKSKPNDERLREYRDSNLSSLERSLLSPAPIYDEFEVVKLADSLAQLREDMETSWEVKCLLATRSPQDVAGELIGKTKLKDIEVRKKYMQAKPEEIYLSLDPMIKLALLVDPVSRGLRARYENEVTSVEARNGALLARALFKLKGTSVPPDATGTPRLSFGVVKGYVENGQKVPFQTTFKGLYEKSEKNGNQPPYELAPSFLQKKSALKLSLPLNFVATVDSIGGNSGSPVVNRNGEVVGVLFDGNIQSLPNNFVYTEDIPRSVMVHGQGIIEALLKVYEATALVDELLGKK